MSYDFLLILLSIFIINLVILVSYSAKLAGGLTGRVASAMALMNVMVLVSRIANGMYAPLLNKKIESSILSGSGEGVEFMLRQVLFVGFIGAVAGFLLVKYTTPLFITAIEHLKDGGMMSALKKAFLSISKKEKEDTTDYVDIKDRPLPIKILVANMLVTGVWTVGVLSSMYAGVLVPEFRATAIHMSAFVNGLATIIMFLYCDPHIAKVVDDARDSDAGKAYSSRLMRYVAMSHVAGVFLAQVALIPGAWLVAKLVVLI